MRDRFTSGLGPPDAKELRLRNEVTEQIQAVVQQVVGDPKAVAILKRVGLYGDFTPDEELYLVECSAQSRYPNWHSYFTAEHKFSTDIYYWSIAQALARRIVAGVFASALDDDARAYVFERAFTVGKPDNWQLNSPSYFDRQYDFKISFDEYYDVFKEYASWTQIPIIIENAINAKRQAPHGYMSDDAFGNLLWPLTMHERKIFRKHGLINDKLSVRNVETALRRGEFSLDDRQAVLADALRYNRGFIKDLHS